MPTHLQWTDVALRLALTVLAGLAIGYNRSEHGKAAGMRTTLLVCLAASIAMIQVNLLLPMAGRPPDSLVMNDLMRLPLGILTGIGFIGAGAILRRDNIVIGVTTAATLWLVTVIGLCLGGGQLALGIAATILGLVALTALKWCESRLRREQYATVAIDLSTEGPSEQDIRRRLTTAGLTIMAAHVIPASGGKSRRLIFDVGEFRLSANTDAPAPLTALAGESGVLAVDWQMRG
jgi:putative Mg2+ transporter-C (MgtC) family protein